MKIRENTINWLAILISKIHYWWFVSLFLNHNARKVHVKDQRNLTWNEFMKKPCTSFINLALSLKGSIRHKHGVHWLWAKTSCNFKHLIFLVLYFCICGCTWLSLASIRRKGFGWEWMVECQQKPHLISLHVAWHSLWSGWKQIPSSYWLKSFYTSAGFQILARIVHDWMVISLTIHFLFSYNYF